MTPRPDLPAAPAVTPDLTVWRVAVAGSWQAVSEGSGVPVEAFQMANGDPPPVELGTVEAPTKSAAMLAARIAFGSRFDLAAAILEPIKQR